MDTEGTCTSKNLGETVRFQSEKKQEWIREVSGKKQPLVSEGTSTAPRLANSSAALFPGRNQYLRTHCSLIVKKTVSVRSAREFKVKGKTEGWTEWQGQRESERRNGSPVGAAKASKELAEWCRLQ